MGVVLEVLARWRYTATSHGSWAESERLTRDMRLAGWLCVAWMCVRESVTMSTIRAVSVLVSLTKCVLAPQLHRAPVCVYACVCVYRTRLPKRPRSTPLPSADLEKAGCGWSACQQASRE